jgi:hypothetical protein
MAQPAQVKEINDFSQSNQALSVDLREIYKIKVVLNEGLGEACASGG